MRRLTSIALSVALCSGFAACSGGHRQSSEGEASERLSIKGSDTMVVLVQRWAERYMQDNPGTVVEVSGGGSGTGLAALVNGTADIAGLSRPLNERERREVGAVETRVALDAIAVYVHEDNAVPPLSIEQLASVFRGRTSRWSDLWAGGSDRTIVLCSRENNSGTYAYFKEHVLDGYDFAVEAQTLPGTAAVIHAVAHDPNSIGYGGIGYGQGVRMVAIVADGEAIAPTMENATSGRYPLARFLHLATRGEPSVAARRFIDWVRSPEGQALVEEVGFFPLPSALAHR